jgi:hypothetical protein
MESFIKDGGAAQFNNCQEEEYGFAFILRPHFRGNLDRMFAAIAAVVVVGVEGAAVEV